MTLSFRSLRTSAFTAPLRFIKAFGKLKGPAASAAGRYRPGNNSKKLLADVVWAEIKYRISAEEYFILNFENLSRRGKKTFIGELDKNRFADLLNDGRLARIFDNKDETYEHFGEYYKRDLLRVRGENSVGAFTSFAAQHPVFVAKPVSAACGAGVGKYDVSDYRSAEELFEVLNKKFDGDFIAEELIVQSEFTEKFHPASVNTVRITTLRTPDGTVLCYPFIRIGKGDSTIDNISSGGIMGLIDVETGVIYDIYSEDGKKYINHPDTGVRILGAEIPGWKDAVDTAVKLAEVLPGNRYTGWDLALTADRGWMMVEANRRAQMVFQYPSGRGCREEFCGYLEKNGISYKL